MINHKNTSDTISVEEKMKKVDEILQIERQLFLKKEAIKLIEKELKEMFSLSDDVLQGIDEIKKLSKDYKGSFNRLYKIDDIRNILYNLLFILDRR
ncbi:MAG: hypothetical protein BWY04_01420 [candidate division CPR1 bacterium ADurb.Bin160]|uniref:Uncharacterized protein n=1 Tax=candidate division CPR1 bacterium ADurb.Bin160 TaxID=1852826 RepID=A0A1V5ZJ60_9BACT|nr:MAG: hypothetical protein BWY04_01420 [candidate division CPR1 bacterium ADurb.Bin160]